ncbi:hypothetical protein VP01_1631g1 [Puccinia sorghi]|uniref:Uncharacterized protein n=1 Tax=Puccinia sorghi TaxID=27349 RepID=A0A0L6VGX3_9BASI|nr:hypothetical protein VP01_1631g1 [Puccinia sorghi]
MSSDEAFILISVNIKLLCINTQTKYYLRVEELSKEKRCLPPSFLWNNLTTGRKKRALRYRGVFLILMRRKFLTRLTHKGSVEKNVKPMSQEPTHVQNTKLHPNQEQKHEKNTRMTISHLRGQKKSKRTAQNKKHSSIEMTSKIDRNAEWIKAKLKAIKLKNMRKRKATLLEREIHKRKKITIRKRGGPREESTLPSGGLLYK